MKAAASARRFLRSPWTISGELAALVLLAVASTLVPQDEAGRTAARVPAVLRAVGLSHVFTSAPFLATVGLAAASLSIVLSEQWKRLRALWRTLPGEAAFRSAPLRLEFDRPAAPGGPASSTRIVTRGRVGLAGSPLFHLGLLALLGAGLVRGLLYREAVVALFEGESLEPGREALSVQEGGPLSRPLALPTALTLESVEPQVYASGQLRGLSTTVRVGTPAGPQQETVAINRPLSLGATTIYAGDSFGPAALWGFDGPGGPVARAVLLRRQAGEGPDVYAASTEFPGDLTVRTRATAPATALRPGSAEVRIARGGVLLAGGRVRPGEQVDFPGGSLTLVALPAWTEFRATRDPSVPLAYLGFGLAGCGALLIFLVVPVDEMVSVTPSGEGEHVVVALRPRRLAPLYRERLAELARREGAPPAC